MFGVLQRPRRFGRAERVAALQFIAAALPQHVALQHRADAGRRDHGVHRRTTQLVTQPVQQRAKRAGRHVRPGLPHQVVVELGAQAAAYAREVDVALELGGIALFDRLGQTMHGQVWAAEPPGDDGQGEGKQDADELLHGTQTAATAGAAG